MLAAWVAGGLLLVWYAATASRGLGWFDAGEFALTAPQLGLAHPPGQPLYMALLALFAALPGVPPLVGMNLLSALAAALCALPVDAMLRRATSLGTAQRVLVLLCVGAIAPVWDQATRLELYSLAGLLSLTLLAWGWAMVEEENHRPARWAALGALSGALAGINPVFAVAAAGTVGLLGAPGLLRRSPLTLLAAAGAATGAGLAALGLTYLYLLFAVGRTGAFVWGDLQTWSGFVHYMTLADYGGSPQRAQGAWASVPAHAVKWAVWLATQGALLPIVLGFAGWAASPRLRRRAVMLVPMAAGVAFSLSYGVYFPEVPDYNGYLLPGMWLAAVGLGGLATLLSRRWATVALALVLASVALLGERPVWQRSRAGLTMPNELARAWLESLPPRAILVAGSDHLVFPAMYLQENEGLRSDVLIFNEGFAASSWYWRHVRARHPDLPSVDLRAPNNAVRLQRFLAAIPDRPVYVEDLRIAAILARRVCPAPWGARAESPCAEAAPEQAFRDAMLRWWSSAAGRDLISPRVLAHLARERAEVFWINGDASGALRALALGTPPARAAELPVPPGLRPPPQLPVLLPDGGDPVLIGDPETNLALGVAALRALGQAEAASAWQAALR